MAERTPYQPLGTGIYRREMSVRRTADGAIGELIDDFHHFTAHVVVDGDRVVDVTARSIRPPWSTCHEAEGSIERLAGMPLAPSIRAAGRHTPARSQCTHMFDAAALAIARLGRGRGDVVYSIAIPDRVDGRTRATLARDGEPILDWSLDGNRIEAPVEYGGRAIVGQSMADWAEASFEADIAEAVLLLQRACLISQGRRLDLEAFGRAQDVPGGPVGACHTYSATVLPRAERVRGSVRNLTAARGTLADER